MSRRQPLVRDAQPVRRRARRRRVQFPCGHLEDERDTGRRMRSRGSAAWVRCRACNVIAVHVEPPPPGRRQVRGR